MVRSHDGAAGTRCIARSLIAATAFALLLAGAAQAQKKAELGTSGAAKAQKLQLPPADPAWTALEREFSLRWQAHQSETQAARQQGLDPAKWPASPLDEYWGRAVAFADRGEVGAIQWCINYSEALGLAPAARNQRRLDLYRKWVKDLPEGPCLREVIYRLQAEANPGRLGGSTTGALLTEIAERVQDKKLRGEARGALGLMLLGAGGPENTKRARELLDQAIEDNPGSEAVAVARGRLFQADRLQIGMRCPDFTAKDVDGVEFKLSDYLGKVVVLEFWGFW
ncbi:MAG: peroxiredoxin family protein [Planctomycetota bacterium]